MIKLTTNDGQIKELQSREIYFCTSWGCRYLLGVNNDLDINDNSNNARHKVRNERLLKEAIDDKTKMETLCLVVLSVLIGIATLIK